NLPLAVLAPIGVATFGLTLRILIRVGLIHNIAASIAALIASLFFGLVLFIITAVGSALVASISRRSTSTLLLFVSLMTIAYWVEAPHITRIISSSPWAEVGTLWLRSGALDIALILAAIIFLYSAAAAFRRACERRFPQAALTYMCLH